MHEEKTRVLFLDGLAWRQASPAYAAILVKITASWRRCASVVAPEERLVLLVEIIPEPSLVQLSSEDWVLPSVATSIVQKASGSALAGLWPVPLSVYLVVPVGDGTAPARRWPPVPRWWLGLLLLRLQFRRCLHYATLPPSHGVYTFGMLLVAGIPGKRKSCRRRSR